MFQLYDKFKQYVSETGLEYNFRLYMEAKFFYMKRLSFKGRYEAYLTAIIEIN